MTSERTRPRVAVIPGDGVGPEVIGEGLRVLEAIEVVAPVDVTVYLWGTQWYLEHGEMMPEDALETLAAHDAIYLGAVGSPAVPDHVTLRELLLKIRFGFDQYVNLRPSRLLSGLKGPLASQPPVDIVFVREGTEGEYAGVGDFLFPETAREVALQTSVFSRYGIQRVLRWTFEYARREGRRRVTSVSKGNAMNYSAVLWDRIFQEVAEDYPDIESNTLLVDAAAMFLVTRPESFDVVVASNLYADVLTEIGAALQGGIGLAASANLNPERSHPSMFEPIHGSAPDIAGSRRVNPIGAIWSLALMLDWLGLNGGAQAVMEAIELVVRDGDTLTPDLGGTATTDALGQSIARRAAERVS